jgi:DnaA family protein
VTVQLPLDIGLRDGSGFHSFHPGPNAEALSALSAVAAGEGERFVYLWGASARGKSHLLQAACRRAGELGMAVAYLPLDELMPHGPVLLDGMDGLELLCLDDLNLLAGRRDWEIALVGLFNRMRSSGGRLVLSGDAAPAQLPLALPDLRSRLQWGLVYGLRPMDDEDTLQALRLRARGRGLELPEETGRYLLRRFPRDMHTLFDLLDRLDTASLAAQRRLTVPFIRTVLSC